MFLCKAKSAFFEKKINDKYRLDTDIVNVLHTKITI